MVNKALTGRTTFPGFVSGVGRVEYIRISASPGDDGQKILQQAGLIRERLGSALRLVDELAGTPQPVAQKQPVTEQMVRTILRLRRHRDRFFKTELFADPAWDMLLELYACELGQQRISISSLCVGAAVPATTALRWITTLEQEELIERRPDPTDGRRFFIQLTRAGRDAMTDYFRAVPSGAATI